MSFLHGLPRMIRWPLYRHFFLFLITMGTFQNLTASCHEADFPQALNLQQLKAQLAPSELCNLETWSQVFQSPTAVKIYALTPTDNLLEVLCDTAAYNVIQVYYLFPRQGSPTEKILPLRFTTLNTEAHQVIQEEQPGLIGLTTYSPKEQVLVNLLKYRGVGDCGSLSLWRFDRKQRKFLLQAVRAVDCQEEEPLRPPAQWPFLYNTNTFPRVEHYFRKYY